MRFRWLLRAGEVSIELYEISPRLVRRFLVCRCSYSYTAYLPREAPEAKKRRSPLNFWNLRPTDHDRFDIVPQALNENRCVELPGV
jgi:hypothetical protein